jgi:hypothetical protein
MKKTIGRIVTLVVVLGLALTVVYVWQNWQILLDEDTINRNPPSAAVVEIAERTAMNETGRRIFYASIPQLNDATDFNNNCSGFEGTMIILGCYVNERIYVFDITDAQVAPAKYFTAAHEMLHAAYARLSEDERVRVNNLLNAEYDRLNDPELIETMAGYDVMEPGQRDNELHSIIGTEYAALSPELEEYYARYFTDQDVVAGMAEQYKKIFRDIKAQRDALEAEMTAEEQAITVAENNYLAEADALSAAITSFNSCANQPGCFATQAQFDAQRTALLNRQAALNTQLNNLNARVENYNNLVAQYNELGGQAATLQNSVNARAVQGIE